MSKSIYCVNWRWFDENGNELERRCVTHAWFTSYRKAQAEYQKALNTLYANYPDRRVERAQVDMGFSVYDGTYELEAQKIYANLNEQSYIRVVLAAVDLH